MRPVPRQARQGHSLREWASAPNARAPELREWASAPNARAPDPSARRGSAR
jgi:hypothetical protein